MIGERGKTTSESDIDLASVHGGLYQQWNGYPFGFTCPTGVVAMISQSRINLSSTVDCPINRKAIRVRTARKCHRVCGAP